jgi:hypothetical protein
MCFPGANKLFLERQVRVASTKRGSDALLGTQSAWETLSTRQEKALVHEEQRMCMDNGHSRRWDAVSDPFLISEYMGDIGKRQVSV